MVVQTLIQFVVSQVAEVVPASLPVTDIEVGDAFNVLLKSMGGLKGASALAIAVFVVQAVMLFFRTKLAEFSGKWRIVIVTGLSLVAGVLALYASGVPVTTALMHANTVAALQVFVHQLFKQFTDKPSA